MNFLLKIIEGPMKGAEVALVPGTTLKFGSSDACDIVIADASIGDVAGELEVAEDGVTFVSSDGKSDKLTPFEIRDFGTTALAIGPAEGKWQEVVRKAVVKASAAGDDSSSKADGDGADASHASESASADGKKAESAAEVQEGRAKHGRGRSCGIGCLVVILILAAAVALAWYFWPKVVEKVPQAESVRARVVETVKSWKAKLTEEKPAAPVVRVPDLTLAQLAAEHGLKLTTSRLSDASTIPLLRGNLPKRTERLAIRALALAIDPSVRFDLTDDETMKNAANELLFAATDGAITVKSAKNRSLVLTGYAPNPAALTKALQALNADVPGIDSVNAKEVRVGGAPPPPVAKTEFATVPDKTVEHFAGKAKPNARKTYPIAGILTQPYPCVVMRNGMRLVEGAVIGTATLIKIQADKLTLKDGATTFDWRP